ILSIVNGNFSLLKDDEESVQRIVNKVKTDLEQKGFLDEIIGTDFESEVERNIVLVLEKMIDHQSTDFLFEEAYRPLPIFKSEEEFHNMSQAEREAYLESLNPFMTKSEKRRGAIEKVFIESMDDFINNEMQFLKSTKEMKARYHEKLEELTQDLLNGGLFSTEQIQELIEDYNEDIKNYLPKDW
ncbi:MAG: hypothetical protein AAF573_18855, partial [Bacteroidota bacterium]